MTENSINIIISAKDYASGVLKNALNQTRTFAQKMRSALVALTPILGGLGATYAIKKMVEDTREFEDAQIALRKTSGMTAEEIRKFSDDVKQMTAYLPTSATEFLNVSAAAAQLGVQGQENLKAFADTMIKMQTATDYTAEQAAYDMKKIADAMDLPYTEVGRLGSAMNSLANTTSASEPILGEFARRVAGTASTVGLTIPQVLSLGATLDSLGVSTEVAGTAMSVFFTGMMADAEKFAEIMRMSPEEWTQLVTKDAFRAMQMFLTQLQQFDTAEMVQAIDNLKLGGTRLAQALLKLANRQDMLEKNLMTAEKAYRENASLAEEYEVAMGGLSAKINTMMGSIQNLSIAIGQSLAPAIKQTADFINDLAANLTKWFDEHPEFKKTIEETAQVFFEMVAPALKTALELFKDLLEWLNALPDDQQKIVMALGAIGAALAAAFVITGPAGAAIVGLTTLILALRYLYENNEGFRNAINAIGKAFVAVGEGISTAVQFLTSLPQNLRQKANEAMQGLITGLSGWKDAAMRPIIETWEAIKEFWASIPEKAKQAGIDIMTAWIEGLKWPVQKVQEAGGWIAEKLADFLGHSLPTKGPLATVFEGGKSIALEWIRGIREGIEALNLEQDLRSAFSGAIHAWINEAQTFESFMLGLLDRIRGAIINRLVDIMIERTIFPLFGFAEGGYFPKGGITPAQEGLYLKSPTILAAETPAARPEWVLPDRKLRETVREEAGGIGSLTVNFNINALDAKSIDRYVKDNRDIFEGVIIEAIRRNSAARGSIRRYAGAG